jgi:hypothetical protein
VSDLAIGFNCVTNLALMPVTVCIFEPFGSEAVRLGSYGNFLSGGLYSKIRIEIVSCALGAVPIFDITRHTAGRSFSFCLYGVMYVGIVSASGTNETGLIVLDDLIGSTAYSTSVIVSVGRLCPVFAEDVTHRNGFGIGLFAICVIAFCGFRTFLFTRCVIVVNVICETVTLRIDQFRLDLATHLTGVSDSSLVFATGVDGNTLLPYVLASVAAGRKPKDAQKRNSKYQKREIDFAEFLHSSFLSEILIITIRLFKWLSNDSRRLTS